MKLSFIFIIATACLSLGYKSYSDELKKHSAKYFTCYAPVFMEVTNNLNDEADLQLSFVNERNGEIYEIYAIVLVETKKEIATYNLEVELHAKSYWELAVASIQNGLTNYEVITKDPQLEKINGNDAVRSEMYGELGEVKVRYKLAVIEGEKAFYQVLTWTLDNQYEHFSPNMDKIITTFVGK